jgi:hypothetical protein
VELAWRHCQGPLAVSYQFAEKSVASGPRARNRAVGLTKLYVLQVSYEN